MKRKAPKAPLWTRFSLTTIWPVQRRALCIGLLLSIPLCVTSGIYAQSTCGSSASCVPTTPTIPIIPTPPKNQCTSTGNGNTCGGSAVATQGNTSGTNQGAGNPINVITGNKYQQETDLPALPGVLGVEIVRHYNSAWRGTGQTGYGWRLSYETDLFVVGHTIQLRQADGGELIFNRDPKDPSHCTSANPANGVIQVHATNRGDEYTWHWNSGRVLSFDSQGRLTTITEPSGEYLSLQRGMHGELFKVTDPQGRSLVFEYANPKATSFRGIVAIQSPVGRFVLSHNDDPKHPGFANLIAITSPSGTSRRYHYASDKGEEGTKPANVTFGHHLSGISLQTGTNTQLQRLSTWAYDSQGRGILSVKGEPLRIGQDGKPVVGTGQEQVKLDFDTPGKTLLTNSLNQTTTYSHAVVANSYRLLQVQGAGCASCGPSNIRYGYDKLGRLNQQTALDEKGLPLLATQSELDQLGRTTRVSRIEYRNGQAQKPQWAARYEYPSNSTSSQPSLIATPSVIAGKEHQIRISYNQYGQATEVTETGYSPLEEKPISRSTSYAYQNINNRSVLTRIDGPLQNGPKGDPSDSDITTITWDAKGSAVQSLTQPGGVTVTLVYDELGRVTRQSLGDGYRRIQTETAYSTAASLVSAAQRTIRTAWMLNAQGQVDESTRQDLLIEQSQFDAAGRLIQATDAAGRSTNYQYDAIGHLLGIADAQGFKSQITLDTEGHLQIAGLYRPDSASTPYRAAYYAYDAYGRQTQRLGPDGALDTWSYNAAGQVQQHTDGNDIRTTYLQAAGKTASFSQSPDGWVRLQTSGVGSSTGNSSDNTAARTSSTVNTLLDDFGRVIRQTLPDHGSKTARFDAANHLITLTHADGSSVRYDWDAAGRLLAKHYFDANAKLQSSTTLRYQGRLLQSASDPEQTTQHDYDALGRPVRETITPKALPSYAIGTAYDPQTGLIRSRTLADGRVLRNQRTDPEHGASVISLSLQKAWVAWVQDKLEAVLPNSAAQILVKALPAQTLASDIQIDPFDGLVASTAGNGLATRKKYDIAGRMTQLSIEKVSTLNYRYGVGPRIRGIDTNTDSGKDSQALSKASYDYPGFGRLQLGAAPEPATSPAPIATIQTTAAATRVSASDSSSAPGTQRAQFDPLGRVTDDGRYRYTYTPGGQVHEVRNPQDQLIARYTYNSLHQRVSKTVFDAANSSGAPSSTTHYLWSQGKLVAEMDAQGHITSQYLYLSEGQRATPFAKLESAQGSERTYFIHADHRGAPLAMTDEDQHMVWQAEISPFGVMSTASSKNQNQQNQTTLNLRLAGQYFDAETGLHDNWHRSYNPHTGRYLQPDPLGYPDGPDAYLYAQGDPVNKSDPMGLYEEDIHYYMTFFLALAAGVDYNDARIMALAAQYVDDNPDTQPVDFIPGTDWISPLTPFTNKQRLLDYHFILSSADTGNTQATYNNSNLLAPVNKQSPQMNNLITAYGKAPLRCGQLQFFGEYLHAFEDTFGHRDPNNVPIDAFKFGIGWGHASYDHDPDYTYNHSVTKYVSTIDGGAIPVTTNWNNNQSRTLTMEQSVYGWIQGSEFVNIKNKKIAIADMEIALNTFNSIKENSDQSGDDEIDPNTGKKYKYKFQLKLETLNSYLQEWGITRPDGQKIDLLTTEAYNSSVAQSNRNKFLCTADGKRLSQLDYPGTLLPGGWISCK